MRNPSALDARLRGFGRVTTVTCVKLRSPLEGNETYQDTNASSERFEQVNCQHFP